MKICIDSNPDQDYAIVELIHGGIIDLYGYSKRIEEYSKIVDWIFFEDGSRKKLKIYGTLGDHEKAMEEHLQRADIFAERLTVAGCKVLIRNCPEEEWQLYEIRGFTDSEMVEIEFQRLRDPEEIYWVKRRIHRYLQVSKFANQREKFESDYIGQELLKDAQAVLEEWEKKEADRRNKIEQFSFRVDSDNSM